MNMNTSQLTAKAENAARNATRHTHICAGGCGFKIFCYCEKGEGATNNKCVACEWAEKKRLPRGPESLLSLVTATNG